MLVKKVISGGQTGADFGALVGAARLGVPTGGCAPRRYRTENGPNYLLKNYGLYEHWSPSYIARTEQNIAQSDATIILSVDKRSPGTLSTVRIAQNKGKPCIGPIDPFSEEAIHEIVVFLLQHKPMVLNVAGNRESKAPGITESVAVAIYESLRIYFDLLNIGKD